MSTIDIGDGLKQPKSILTNLRGVVDFGNLAQFDLFERGYGLLAVINAPRCMSTAIQSENTNTKLKTAIPELQDQFVDILENEFRGLSGLDDMTSDASDITDGISTLNIITKVTEQSGSSITINLLREKAGRPISKYIDYFLRCIKDPRSQFKTYLGAITAKTVNKETIDPSFDKEVFNLLYIVTDNTGYRVEGAYILLCAQPTTSDLSMLESEKGSYDFVDVSIPFNAFPIRSKAINYIASNYLSHITIYKDSTEFNWTVSDGVVENGKYGKLIGTSEDGTSLTGGGLDKINMNISVDANKNPKTDFKSNFKPAQATSGGTGNGESGGADNSNPTVQ